MTGPVAEHGLESVAPPSDLSDAQRAQVQALSHDEAEIPAPVWLARRAQIPNDVVERAHAAADLAGFWRGKAALVDWMEPFGEVMRFTPPNHEWFVGGKLNVSVNCLDRHVAGGRRLKAALIWIGEDGEEQTFTYNRLYREVNRFANALRRLEVKKGDTSQLPTPPPRCPARACPPRQPPAG